MTSPNLPPQVDALTDLIRAEMQKILAEGAKPIDPAAAPSAAPSQSIKIPVNGQVFEFTDEKQLGDAIQKVVAESQAAIQAARTQVLPPPPPEPEASKGPALDTFVEKLKSNPAEGIDYAIREQYGVGIGDLVAAAQQTRMTNEVMVAGRFKEMHPEFTPTPQNAGIVNQMAQYLGLPYTVDGLEAAYMMAVSRGAIKPDWSYAQGAQGQSQGRHAEQQPQYGAPPSQYGLGGFAGGRTLPPPNLGGRGGTEPPPDVIAMAEQMTAPQLEKFIRDQGHLFKS